MKRHEFMTLINAAATRIFGKRVGGRCRPGDVICLSGELGCGKTTLAQAIAEGIGIDQREYVSSPSFAVLHEYQGAIPIYHMDFYRLADSEDVIGLGIDEYFYQDGVTIIEWFERAHDIIPPERLIIDLAMAGGEARRARLSSEQPYWMRHLTQLTRPI